MEILFFRRHKYYMEKLKTTKRKKIKSNGTYKNFHG